MSCESDSSSDEEEISGKNIEVKEVPLCGLEDGTIESVEKELEELCLKFKNQLEIRFKREETLEQAKEIFHNTSSFKVISPDSNANTREEGDVGLNSQIPHLPLTLDSLLTEEEERESCNHYEARERMKKLVETLPEPVRVDYWDAEDLDSLVKAYQSFVSFIKSRPEEGTLESSYADWCKATSNKYDFNLFKGLFERIEIKSYSESFCETIGNYSNLKLNNCPNNKCIFSGSYLKRSKGSSLQLWAENFSREIFTLVNLPGLHVLEEQFIPDIVKALCQTKEFHRRTTGLALLVGGREGLSASVTNNRTRLDKVTRLPLSVFQKK